MSSNKQIEVIKYEVIFDYPHSNFTIGQIIELKYDSRVKELRYEWAQHDGINWETKSFFDEFPQIFKPLQQPTATEDIQIGDELSHPYQPYTFKATEANKDIWKDCKKITATEDKSIEQMAENYLMKSGKSWSKENVEIFIDAYKANTVNADLKQSHSELLEALKELDKIVDNAGYELWTAHAGSKVAISKAELLK